MLRERWQQGLRLRAVADEEGRAQRLHGLQRLFIATGARLVPLAGRQVQELESIGHGSCSAATVQSRRWRSSRGDWTLPTRRKLARRLIDNRFAPAPHAIGARSTSGALMKRKYPTTAAGVDVAAARPQASVAAADPSNPDRFAAAGCSVDPACCLTLLDKASGNSSIVTR